MLNSRLALHDVDDVEALCGWVIERSKFELSHHEREDLLAYLVAVAWELSTRYDPKQVRKFSIWAGTTLRLRTVDWVRSYRGRTRWTFSDGRSHERERPQLVSLDDPEHDRLEQSQRRGSLDDGASRLADELRALDKRGRRPSRRRDWLGDEAA